tara:strand:- start:1582 stop:1806 length:225 start_codon:yes stop_codon:yes gene_type:complete
MKNLIRKILCKCGLHKWKYNVSEFESTARQETYCLNYAEKPTTRTCQCCPTKEEKSFHCLGTRPLKHLTEWKKI